MTTPQTHEPEHTQAIESQMDNKAVAISQADFESPADSVDGKSQTETSRSGDLEKDGPPETPSELPSKHRSSSLARWLEYTFFSVYRQMFAAIFTINVIVLIIFMIKNNGSPTLSNVKNATSANLLACLMMRQENCVNLVYEIFTCVPHSWPVWLRSKLAKVYHYGGVHSGCGVAAVVWFIFYTALSTRKFVENPTHGLQVANLCTCYGLLTMFLFILGGAYPRFRIMAHDYFEAIHRFAGWTALMIFWSQTFLIAAMNHNEGKGSYAFVLFRAPSFWFLALSTCFTFLSWSRLRHRDVYPEVLSGHVTRLHFKYMNMKPFYGLKISDRPLLEWHAFATVPDDDGNGFSVVVSNAGDWTSKMINESPKKLWTRGYPLHGLLYTSRLFNQIVLVATGSGIGPCLSLMAANDTPRRILWSTRNPLITYGEKVTNTVLKADPKANIWDTKEKGYPDIVMETYKLLRECNAEAVFIISNPKLTKKVVYAMECRGIPAYGAIFDS